MASMEKDRMEEAMARGSLVPATPETAEDEGRRRFGGNLSGLWSFLTIEIVARES
jgi:hypothetical protein